MKKHIGKFLVVVSLLYIIGGAIYQTLQSRAINVPADGKEVFGNNPVFKNILGVKTVYRYLAPGEGWLYYGTDIETPAWMQSIGAPSVVSFGYYPEEHTNSPWQQVAAVKALRFSAKVLIPFIVFMIGYRLSGRSRKEVEVAELETITT